MRFSLLLLQVIALVCFVILGKAQTASPQFSNPVKISRNIVQVAVVAEDESGFYVMEEDHGKTDAIHLIRLSKSTMMEEWRKKIEIPIIQESVQRFEGLVFVKGKFILFTSGFSKDKDKYYAYATYISKDGEVNSANVFINVRDMSRTSLSSKLAIHTSPDESKILLFFEPFQDSKEPEPFYLKIYSDELDLLFERELKLPMEEGTVKVHNYAVDNLGNVYMLSGQNPEKNAVLFQRTALGKYVLYHYNFEANKLKEYDVSLQDKQVVSVAMSVRDNGSLVIGGYYSNDLTFSVAGTFVFELDPLSEAIKSASFTAFTKDFIGQFFSEREMRKERSLTDLYLDKIILNADSSTTLLGEEYFITEQIVPDLNTGRQTIRNIYHFDNIVATRINRDGKQVFTVKVPKRQYSYSNDQTCSYVSFVDKEGVSLMFNDSEKNQKRLAEKPQGDADSWFSADLGVTTRVKIGNSGKIERDVLVQNRAMKVSMKPMISSELPNGTAILGFEDGRAYRYFIAK